MVWLQEQLGSLLRTAESLRVKGLAQASTEGSTSRSQNGEPQAASAAADEGHPNATPPPFSPPHSASSSSAYPHVHPPPALLPLFQSAAPTSTVIPADTSPTVSHHFQLSLYQSIALDEGYISSFEFKSIRAAVWPQIHDKLPWVGVFLRHPRDFRVHLWPNTRFDRLGLKRLFIERFKSYRTVCSFVELDKKQPR